MFVEIEDPALEPFTIEIDDNNHTVYRWGKVTDKESKNYGQPTKLLIAYCGSLPAALDTIYRGKVNLKTRTTDLEGYMREMKKQFDKMFEFFKAFDLEAAIKADGKKVEPVKLPEVDLEKVEGFDKLPVKKKETTKKKKK